MTKAEFQRQMRLSERDGWNRAIQATTRLALRQGAFRLAGKISELAKPKR